jgi:hypothetical protein
MEGINDGSNNVRCGHVKFHESNYIPESLELTPACPGVPPGVDTLSTVPFMVSTMGNPGFHIRVMLQFGDYVQIS